MATTDNPTAETNEVKAGCGSCQTLGVVVVVMASCGPIFDEYRSNAYYAGRAASTVAGLTPRPIPERTLVLIGDAVGISEQLRGMAARVPSSAYALRRRCL